MRNLFFILLITAMAFGRSANQVQVVPNAGSLIPVWGQVNLSSSAARTGVLPIANGGTNHSSTTAGQVIFGGAGGTSYTDTSAFTYTAASGALSLAAQTTGIDIVVLTAQSATDNETLRFFNSTAAKNYGFTANFSTNKFSLASNSATLFSFGQSSGVQFPTVPTAVTASDTANHVMIDSSGNLSKRPVNYADNGGTCTGTYTDAAAYHDITGQSVTITTTGRPVSIIFSAPINVNRTGALQVFTNSANQNAAANFRVTRDGTGIFQTLALSSITTSSTLNVTSFEIDVPAASFNVVDFGATAGSHTYTLQTKILSTSGQVQCANDMTMAAFEL